MASTFALTGTYQAMPPSGMPSGDPLITAPVDERQTLDLELSSLLVAPAATWTALPFGGLPSASVLVLKAVGGAVRVRVGYVDPDGDPVTQDIPVDSFLALTCATRLLTSVAVRPESGVAVTVKFFLGHRAG